jgi:hypothetical protein
MTTKNVNQLHEHNQRAKRWGDDFDEKYRRTVKCLGWMYNLEAGTVTVSVAGIQRKHKAMFPKVKVPAERTVQYHLRGLEAGGVIERTERFRASGKQRSNEWKIDFTRIIREGQGMSAHLWDAPLAAEDCTPTCTPGCTPSGTPVAPLTRSSSRVTRSSSRSLSRGAEEDEAPPVVKKKTGPAARNSGGIDNTYWVHPVKELFTKAGSGTIKCRYKGGVMVSLSAAEGKALWTEFGDKAQQYKFLQSKVSAELSAQRVVSAGKCDDCDCARSIGRTVCMGCFIVRARRADGQDAELPSKCRHCGAERIFARE